MNETRNRTVAACFLRQQGKVGEFWTDWKSRGKSHKILVNWDRYYLIFQVILKWTVHYLLKWVKFSVKKNKTLKKYWKNGKRYWKSQGILSVRKSGNPDCGVALQYTCGCSVTSNALHSEILTWNSDGIYYRPQQ